MSGGGGGGGSQPNYAALTQAAAVPRNDIQAATGPQFGPTYTPNPYTQEGEPYWMNGWFAMPSWGMDPFGDPLTQEQLMGAPTEAPPQAPQDSQAPQTPLARTSGQTAFNLGYSPRGDVRAYNQMTDPYERYQYEQARQSYEKKLARRREYAQFGVGGKDGGG